MVNKIMKQKKPYIVYTWTLANKLYNLGFKPLGKELNTKDPTHEVILFEDTPALRQAIKELTKKG